MSQPLVPEMKVLDLHRSLEFYVEVVGLAVRYERPEERFASLARDDVELMLEQIVADDRVGVGDLVPPLGRGVSFQIQWPDLDALIARLAAAEVELFLPVEERSYGTDRGDVRQRQVWVQDPDGYLLRFVEVLG